MRTPYDIRIPTTPSREADEHDSVSALKLSRVWKPSDEESLQFMQAIADGAHFDIPSETVFGIHLQPAAITSESASGKIAALKILGLGASRLSGALETLVVHKDPEAFWVETSALYKALGTDLNAHNPDILKCFNSYRDPIMYHTVNSPEFDQYLKMVAGRNGELHFVHRQDAFLRKMQWALQHFHIDPEMIQSERKEFIETHNLSGCRIEPGILCARLFAPQEFFDSVRCTSDVIVVRDFIGDYVPLCIVNEVAYREDVRRQTEYATALQYADAFNSSVFDAFGLGDTVFSSTGMRIANADRFMHVAQRKVLPQGSDIEDKNIFLERISLELHGRDPNIYLGIIDMMRAEFAGSFLRFKSESGEYIPLGEKLSIGSITGEVRTYSLENYAGYQVIRRELETLAHMDSAAYEEAWESSRGEYHKKRTDNHQEELALFLRRLDTSLERCSQTWSSLWDRIQTTGPESYECDYVNGIALTLNPSQGRRAHEVLARLL